MFLHFLKACFPVSKVSNIAESVIAKNMKQANGLFRMYEDATVEPANGCTGKRETGKSAKKPGEVIVASVQSFGCAR
ncbi:hypothetical protein CerSpe_202230 [Prunus speciosa]